MGQIRLNGKNYSNATPKSTEEVLPTGYTRLIDHAPISRDGNYLSVSMPEYYSDFDYIYLVCVEDDYQTDYVDDLFNTHINYKENIDTPLIDRTYRMRTDSITHEGISVQVPYLDNEFNYNGNTFTLTITDESITATSNTGTLTDANLLVIGVHRYDYWLDAFETQTMIDTNIQLSTQAVFNEKDWEIDFETKSLPIRSGFIDCGNGNWNSFTFRIRTNRADENIGLQYSWGNGQTTIAVNYSEIGNVPTTWKIKKVNKTLFLYINGSKIWTSSGTGNIAYYNDSTLRIGYDLGGVINFGYFGFRWIN